MATNEEVLTHLQGLRERVTNAVNTVNEWRRFSSMMTAGSKTAELANCNGWNGSNA